MAAPSRERPAVAWPELPAPARPRRLLAGVLGVAAAAVVLALRLSGAAEGAAGIALAVVLVLAVPTSRELARRVLLAGTTVSGWLPVVWWVPLPVGPLGRVTIGLAVLAGGLAAWVGLAERPVRRARLLVPRVRGVDLLLPVVAALAALVYVPFLRPKTARETLGLLLSGWDNSAHFSMVHMTRGFGVTVDALTTPPPTGGTWQFASYPQGYHAVVATTTELLLGPERADVGTELGAYAESMALVVLAAVLTVVAGLCALPAVRRRPAVAVPAGAFVAAVYVLGPGAAALDGGFGNFLLACALVVALVLVALPLARFWSPLHLAALGGAVVGIASGWALLLVVALPAALMALLPLRRSRWRARWPQVVIGMLVVVAVVGALARTVLVLLRVQVATNPLEIAGGIVAPDLGVVVAATFACIGACVLAGRAGIRWTALAATPLVGEIAAATLVALQIGAAGKITYYGFKFLTGLELVALPLLAVAVAAVLAGRGRPLPLGAARRPRAGAGPADPTVPPAGVAPAQDHTVALRSGPVPPADAAPAQDGTVAPQPGSGPPERGALAVRGRRGGRVRTVLAAAVITVAVTQVFGLSAAEPPPRPTPGSALPMAGPVTPAAPGAVNRARQLDLVEHPPTTAWLADRAPAVAAAADGRPVVYLDIPADRGVDPILAAQWFFALTDTWTTSANAAATEVNLGDRSIRDALAATRRVLLSRPDVLVAMPPVAAELLRDQLGGDLAQRLVPMP